MKYAICVLCVLIMAGCQTITPAHAPDTDHAGLATANPEAASVVRQFVDAYNNKDLETMMTLAADDITWLSVQGDETSIVTSGAAAMRKELQAHLGPDARPKSLVEILRAHGDFVVTFERAYWMKDGKETSQASFAIYEVTVGRIRRVWYFPASP